MATGIKNDVARQQGDRAVRARALRLLPALPPHRLAGLLSDAALMERMVGGDEWWGLVVGVTNTKLGSSKGRHVLVAAGVLGLLGGGAGLLTESNVQQSQGARSTTEGPAGCTPPFASNASTCNKTPLNNRIN